MLLLPVEAPDSLISILYLKLYFLLRDLPEKNFQCEQANRIFQLKILSPKLNKIIKKK